MRAVSNINNETIRIGVDTGGTFTDFIAIKNQQIISLKIPSTPAHPAQAILLGLQRILQELQAQSAPLEIVHGTTVATNALLERKGAKTALVTTAGFEDVIAIGRQARPDLYNFAVQRPASLVSTQFRFGIRERIASSGEIITALQPRELSALVRKLKQARVESVAISLLFSFVNALHEQQIVEELAKLQLPLSVSHQLWPEYREYERTSTVVINAYLAPKVSHYLKELQIGLATLTDNNSPKAAQMTSQAKRVAKASYQLRIMQSSGGSISATTAAAEPVRTILSGPAGGVIAATNIAALAGFPNIVTFDMGGTSTDVSLCRGTAQTTNEAMITGLPVAVPVLDIHTVGAGGGSIAYVDEGGALRVGPQSAGADPGPACYGRGTLPTVTDANAVLGRFGAAGLLSGKMSLDHMRAEKALDELAQQMSDATRKKVTRQAAALGVIQVANTNMERALRLVSIERGQDPRHFSLVSFGGAGGLHAVALAAALRIPRVVIPAYPGAFSALGVLLADVVKDYQKTVMLTCGEEKNNAKIEATLKQQFSHLQQTAIANLRQEGFVPKQTKIIKSLALRYRGQSFELEVPIHQSLQHTLKSFHQLHQERYGHANPMGIVEIVSLRLRGVGITTKPHISTYTKSRKKIAPSSFVPVRLTSKTTKIPLYERDNLPVGFTCHEPALIVEYGATTLLPEGWQLTIDRWKNMLLQPR